jgi:hypothetical protein
MTSSRPESPLSSAPKTDELRDSKHAGDASDASDKAATQAPPDEGNKATKVIVMTSVFLCMFLVALDRTIISTVKPLNYSQALPSQDSC